MYVVVDPNAVEFALPDRDGAFAMTVPPGDYTLKAFFDGKPVGKPSTRARRRRGLELKEPMAVGGATRSDDPLAASGTCCSALAVAVALYVVYVAVGQYNRQTTLALKEGLASDSQTVEWALKIRCAPPARRAARGQRRRDPAAGARRRQRRQGRQGPRQGQAPTPRRRSSRSTTPSRPTGAPTRSSPSTATATSSPQVGYDAVAGNDDFELGGYPAVNDALHGWLRDDVWVLGSKMYVVVARPVEYDVTQRPAGAIVGLKEVNKRFADGPRQANADERRVLRRRASAWRAASGSRASTTRSSTPSATT